MLRPLLASLSIFLLFLITGALLLSLAHLVPDGAAQAVIVTFFAAAFIGLFIWLLISSVRRILVGPKRLGLEAASTLFNLALVIVAFAVMYRRFGIIDNTAEGSPVIYDFWTSIYYSVVPFTTLGYGDFYPVGLGRTLAAMEALTGYIILGVLVHPPTSPSPLPAQGTASIGPPEGLSHSGVEVVNKVEDALTQVLGGAETAAL